MSDNKMLDNIKIEGYKSIKHLDLDLGAINILIGANGAGKTNFISFFELVNAIYEQRLQNFTMKISAERLLFYGSKCTPYIEGYLKFSNNVNSNAYSFTLQPRVDGRMFLAKEDSLYNGDSSPKENLSESTIRGSSQYRDSWLREHLESYRIYHFHDTSMDSKLRSKPKIDDVVALKSDGSNLPAILFLLQEKYPKTLKRIELVVKEVVPSFGCFLLKPDLYEEGRILLRWKDTNGHDFDVKDLSDGSLRFIALATLFLQPVLPGIIVIDEPELGLHPTAIDKLAGMIKSAAARNCQIIVATQSVNLMNNFDPKDIITVDRKYKDKYGNIDGESSFDRLDLEDLKDWLEDYSPGELWVRSIIKGQPRINSIADTKS